MSVITPNSTILFQGDSITDGARNYEESPDLNTRFFGYGYATLIADKLLYERAEDNLNFHNRGISGNRVVDLYARWRVDAVNLNPDVISILIGVNDTWHHFNYNNGVEVSRYEQVYRMLLDYTLECLPKVRFVLCEPFVLHTGVVDEAWLDDIKQRQRIVRQLAEEYQTVFVPFQQAFDDACKRRPKDYWLFDGVHPTMAGNGLMADLWLKSVIEH